MGVELLIALISADFDSFLISRFYVLDFFFLFFFVGVVKVSPSYLTGFML